MMSRLIRQYQMAFSLHLYYTALVLYCQYIFKFVSQLKYIII